VTVPAPGAVLRAAAAGFAFLTYGALLLLALSLHGVVHFGFRDAAKRAPRGLRHNFARLTGASPAEAEALLAEGPC
jgi:hypothetical protein